MSVLMPCMCVKLEMGNVVELKIVLSLTSYTYSLTFRHWSRVHYASVVRHNKLKTMMKRVLLHDCDQRCLLRGRARDRQMQDAFHLPRSTGVRIWAVIPLQTLWCMIGGRSRS